VYPRLDGLNVSKKDTKIKPAHACDDVGFVDNYFEQAMHLNVPNHPSQHPALVRSLTLIRKINIHNTFLEVATWEMVHSPSSFSTHEHLMP
jgi:hypothetical protein